MRVAGPGAARLIDAGPKWLARCPPPPIARPASPFALGRALGGHCRRGRQRTRHRTGPAPAAGPAAAGLGPRQPAARRASRSTSHGSAPQGHLPTAAPVGASRKKPWLPGRQPAAPSTRRTIRSATALIAPFQDVFAEPSSWLRFWRPTPPNLLHRLPASGLSGSRASLPPRARWGMTAGWQPALPASPENPASSGELSRLPRGSILENLAAAIFRPAPCAVRAGEAPACQQRLRGRPIWRVPPAGQAGHQRRALWPDWQPNQNPAQPLSPLQRAPLRRENRPAKHSAGCFFPRIRLSGRP